VLGEVPATTLRSPSRCSIAVVAGRHARARSAASPRACWSPTPRSPTPTSEPALDYNAELEHPLDGPHRRLRAFAAPYVVPADAIAAMLGT
jgi:hypothetical protein